nr:hypothetical protein [Tanacetum cinerariifolium]
LAVIRYVGCGGGVAADSSVSNGLVSSVDGAWSAVLESTTTKSVTEHWVKHSQHMVAPQQQSHRHHALGLGYNLGQVCNLERVRPEERPLRIGPLASQRNIGSGACYFIDQ